MSFPLASGLLAQQNHNNWHWSYIEQITVSETFNQLMVLYAPSWLIMHSKHAIYLGISCCVGLAFGCTEKPGCSLSNTSQSPHQRPGWFPEPLTKCKNFAFCQSITFTGVIGCLVLVYALQHIHPTCQWPQTNNTTKENFSYRAWLWFSHTCGNLSQLWSKLVPKLNYFADFKSEEQLVFSKRKEVLARSLKNLSTIYMLLFDTMNELGLSTTSSEPATFECGHWANGKHKKNKRLTWKWC